ncbi:uncharacterized protein LOC120518333 isoform X1 [Polypterus senegalus]|uniref:uncharacterized protein LOC120518333 isoform X1 n=1 Tax=Polypterus senegalus TaxID=55291 RepID=UPI001966C97F|nr:uncharacterized protein LOC120518333 isoform X1 [Polypterus senegalus]
MPHLAPEFEGPRSGWFVGIKYPVSPFARLLARRDAIACQDLWFQEVIIRGLLLGEVVVSSLRGSLKVGRQNGRPLGPLPLVPGGRPFKDAQIRLCRLLLTRELKMEVPVEADPVLPSQLWPTWTSSPPVPASSRLVLVVRTGFALTSLAARNSGPVLPTYLRTFYPANDYATVMKERPCILKNNPQLYSTIRRSKSINKLKQLTTKNGVGGVFKEEGPEVEECWEGAVVDDGIDDIIGGGRRKGGSHGGGASFLLWETNRESFMILQQ